MVSDGLGARFLVVVSHTYFDISRSIQWFGRDGVIGLSWILSSVFVLSLFGLPTTHAYLVHSNRFFMAPSVLVLPFVALGLQVLQVNGRFYQVCWCCLDNTDDSIQPEFCGNGAI